jgi:hypothetical protein
MVSRVCSMKYSRATDVIQAPKQTRATKRRNNYLPNEDSVIARALNGNTTSLLTWLERVETRFYGVPTDIGAADAILYALRITAGEVEYADAQISRLTEDELFERPTTTHYVVMPDGTGEYVEEKRDSETITRWVYLRQSAVDRMAKYARMAIELGLSEREVAFAKQEAKLIAIYIEAIMDDLELTKDQRSQVGESMRRHANILR